MAAVAPNVDYRQCYFKQPWVGVLTRYHPLEKKNQEPTWAGQLPPEPLFSPEVAHVVYSHKDIVSNSRSLMEQSPS
jgi:hypothetical protein